DFAIGKILLAEGDTTQMQGFEQFGLKPGAYDKFGRAAANVHHESFFARYGQHMTHTGKDQARFFPAGNNLYRKSKGGLGAWQEIIHVGGDPKGIGGHCTYAVRVEVAQSLAEAFQHFNSPQNRCLVQPGSAVEAGGQPDGFFHAVYWVNLRDAGFMHNTAYYKAEAVGAEV